MTIATYHSRFVKAASLWVAAALLLMLMSSISNAQNTYFRYTNNQGVRVISDVIPAEYVSKGYEVINSHGHVVSEVPPEPSAEEKHRLQKEKEEKERIAKWDTRLLANYSHIDDIHTAKARKLSNLDDDIASLRLTLKKISQTIKRYQAEAAASERQGVETPEALLTSLTQLQKHRALTLQNIQDKQVEKHVVAERYDRDIERFNVIHPTNDKNTALNRTSPSP